MTAKCEFCSKKLNAKEFVICQACSDAHDHFRVWRGEKMNFNSEPMQQRIPTPFGKGRKTNKIQPQEKKQGRQMKLV